MKVEPAIIEWYSGYTRYDTPRRIWWQNRWLEVAAVLQRGFTPSGAFLKLQTADRGIFLLEYSLDLDRWHVANRS